MIDINYYVLKDIASYLYSIDISLGKIAKLMEFNGGLIPANEVRNYFNKIDDFLETKGGDNNGNG